MVAVHDSAGRGISFQETFRPILPENTEDNTTSDDDVKASQQVFLLCDLKVPQVRKRLPHESQTRQGDLLVCCVFR